MAMMNITDGNFAAEVLQTPGLVLADFWAPWCAPCKVQRPILEELAEELTTVKFTSLNVDDSPTTAGKYQIMSIPTTIIFKDGAPVAQLIGLQPKEALRAKLTRLQRGSE